MIKKFLLIGLFIALLLPMKTALGVVTYSRSPAGYTIQNPVSFDVSFDDYYTDTGCSEGYDYWGIYIEDVDTSSYMSQTPHPSSTTLNQIFILNLPANVYNRLDFVCEEHEFDEGTNTGYPIESNGGEPIFEVVEAVAPTGGFLTLPTSTISDLQAQIGQLVTDSSLIWILAIALPLGFWIIYKMIDTGSKVGRKK
jgi:hypothetical protein